MGVADWRAWTNQSGGTLPTAPNPPGTPWQNNQVFPGVNPIPDLISGVTSIPPTPSLSAPNALNVPSYVAPVDPFGGWTADQEKAPTYLMRPVVPGITS